MGRRFWASLGRVFLEDAGDRGTVYDEPAYDEDDTRSLLGEVEGPGYDPTHPVPIDKRRAYAALAALSLSPWLLMALSASINDALDDQAGARFAHRVMASSAIPSILLVTFALNLVWGVVIARTRLIESATDAESGWLRVLPYPSVALPAVSVVVLVIVLFGAALSLVQILVALIVGLIVASLPLVFIVFVLWRLLGRRRRW